MAIKVTLGATEKTQQEKPFPKLMVAKNTGRVVFFLEPNNGVQLNTIFEHDDKEPHYDDSWIMSDFTDYNEPITIQNQ